MTSLLLTFLLAVAGLQQGPAASTDDITRVRELYALASYEDALARLDAAGAAIEPQDAAQYRALCLLGLSRVVEAEQTMERFVVDYPSYAMNDSDVSPRLVTMYNDARRRVIPSTARARYSEAKSAYDRQQFTRAARAFREVLELLGDDAIVNEVAGLRDLKMLTDGFLGLAEGEIEKAERPAAPAAPVAPAVAASTPAPAAAVAAVPAVESSTPAARDAAPAEPVASGPVYSVDDATVVAPTEVSRWMPQWNPPPVMARLEFRGLLEIVVNEQGLVTSAALVTPVHPQYDSQLLEATERWRFRPATKDGAPVAYRRTLEIVLGRK